MSSCEQRHGGGGEVLGRRRVQRAVDCSTPTVAKKPYVRRGTLVDYRDPRPPAAAGRPSVQEADGDRACRCPRPARGHSRARRGRRGRAKTVNNALTDFSYAWGWPRTTG